MSPKEVLTYFVLLCAVALLWLRLERAPRPAFALGKGWDVAATHMRWPFRTPAVGRHRRQTDWRIWG